jgi:2'-5' RNA ligase
MSTFLLKKIADHQTTLEQHSFCQHLCQRQDISLQAYRFVPHMTFLVLGFWDFFVVVKVC